MRRDGCPNAIRVGGGGDLRADVKATDPYGRRWVIQCKHRPTAPLVPRWAHRTCRSSTAPPARSTAPTSR
ncbi:hypothetical protein [Streptomyces altiplanensis]